MTPNRCGRSPAAVILDHRMPPGPSGMEIIRVPGGEGFAVPIVLDSAHVTADVEEEAKAIGVELIAKGSMKALFRALVPLLARREP